MEQTCVTCQNVSGQKLISPGPFIYEGQYWLVDHAYPTGLKGWLVVPLKRHATALHELSGEEFAELATLLERSTKLLREELGCEKEYAACFYEAEGARHVHVHVIARPPDLPDELTGTGIFAMLRPTAAAAVPREEIQVFCERLRARFWSGRQPARVRGAGRRGRRRGVETSVGRPVGLTR